MTSMPLLRCEPASLKESLLFAAGSMLPALAPILFFSYFSIPPAHRDPRRLRVDLAVALALAVAISLIGAFVFNLAQAWRRRQDVLYPRTLRPWLALCLGALYPIAFLAVLNVAMWVLRIDETLLGWIVGLGLPVGLSRLAWRSEEPPSFRLGP
jgi:hypothetical protein